MFSPILRDINRSYCYLNISICAYALVYLGLDCYYYYFIQKQGLLKSNPKSLTIFLLLQFIKISFFSILKKTILNFKNDQNYLQIIIEFALKSDKRKTEKFGLLFKSARTCGLHLDRFTLDRSNRDFQENFRRFNQMKLIEIFSSFYYYFECSQELFLHLFYQFHHPQSFNVCSNLEEKIEILAREQII